jgi:tetratricopeptide (TPR) repeat protein
MDRSHNGAHALGALHQAEAFFASSRGDLGVARSAFEATLDAYVEAGDRRSTCSTRTNLGFVLVELGGFVEAERVLRASLDEAERMGLSELVATILQNLGYALMNVDRLDEAQVLEERSIETMKRLGSARMEGFGHVYLARIHIAQGDAAAAEREANAAIALLVASPWLQAPAAATRARALSAAGRAAAALASAEEAFALLTGAGGALEEGEALVRLVHAEALAAAGRHAEASAALAVARERLLARADRISDPAWRERFLTAVPENAATLAMTIGAAT